ncbi:MULTISPECIES: LLM class flavin-dependent oxidoreductase [Streptosporangiaceae]|uniref:Alkanesulfonate monooxygenase SsuD/methylene tetrahydromethanopterin reductase-like flavin-dependent oxidoreductase (Luciferase family) n=2 Tax=Streptosporangiaceae TaxID=2004 RepID=A0A841DCF4_PLAVE|nr:MULTISPECIES: LLM class flavin-dependent oxidoreductase [Streptosporangiaceae]MBB5966473.1 alkanesulfonate monooxygenase SsuD/methylene tetrahydromethanopterin reductase-like flavin-dependent oxidoreductase (luciferase family) [Planomonospora venezuelensis]GIH78162.1 alkane 1-monooxygenase [Planobispora longispora]GIN04132.1 alkane 1-monooxygenase [Planomonospora venezuelensis]
MDIGLFYAHQLPSTPPSVGFEWDLQTARWAEEYGLAEAWFSEHFTEGYERWNSPELHIAALSRETSRIKLGTAANLLPYHNPVALAYRLMALDHITKGRLMVGFGAGAYPTDAQLFGTSMPEQNHEMLEEAQDLIRRIWANKGESLKIQGKHFGVDVPPNDNPLLLGNHWRPYQENGPRVAMAAFSPRSSTLFRAGARGDIPLTIAMTDEFLAGHWEVYAEGAASTGRTPDRRDWRVVRDVIVADTDEEAFALACSTPLRRTQEEWVLPYNMDNIAKMLPEGVSPEDLNIEALAYFQWIVGSVDTVVDRLAAEYEQCGGFGSLLVYNYDCHEEPEAFRRHLELLGTEVAPRLTERVGKLTSGH